MNWEVLLLLLALNVSSFSFGWVVRGWVVRGNRERPA